MVIADLPWLAHPERSVPDGIPVGVLDIRDAQGYDLHAVAVVGDVAPDLRAAVQRRRQHEAHVPVLEHP